MINRRDFLIMTTQAWLSPCCYSQTWSESEEIDLNQYDLTFEDNFDTLNLNKEFATDKVAPTGWVPDSGDGPNPSIELQRFIDPRDPRTNGAAPFQIQNSILQIKAKLVPATIPPEVVNHRQISSGLLMTRGWFRQQYGYFEARLKMPKGQTGNWPCFWLLPDNGVWPPEIDILEQVGEDTRLAYATIHAAPYEEVGKTQLGSKINTPDLSEDFHLFGVDWQPDSIRYFFDRRFVWAVPPLNGLSRVQVLDGGSGYDGTTRLNVTGGGEQASGAIIQPEIVQGQIKSIRIENSGTGFVDPPRIEILGRGKGAVLAPIISHDPAVPIHFHMPMYIILNLSIGGKGSWTGESSLTPSSFPRVLEVDYVRAYSRKPQLYDAPSSSRDIGTTVDPLASIKRVVPDNVLEKVATLITNLQSFEGRFDSPHERTWDGATRKLLQAFDRFIIRLPIDGDLIFLDLKNVSHGLFRYGDLTIRAAFPRGSGYRNLDNHFGFWPDDKDQDNHWFCGFDEHNGIFGSKDKFDYRSAAGPFQQGFACRGASNTHVVATRGPINNLVLYCDGKIWHTSAIYSGQSVPAYNAPFRLNSKNSISIRTVHYGRRLMPYEVEFLSMSLKDFFF